jgi:threonine dehydrogenase-like Zn-dependent dehydrogenase
MTAEVIDVVAVGVCGSDLQRLRAGFAVKSLGHELVGRRPDQPSLVAIRPLNPCRTCPACKKGWTEQCPDDASIGRLDTGDGGFSGKVSAKANQLYPLPAELPVPVATLTDPLACVLHALAGIELRDARVLVIGDGPMAALAATYARHAGAHVTVAVKDATRRERMAGFGHATAVARDLPGNRYHIVIESVGGVSSEPISLAASAVAPLGQVVCLGVYPAHVTAGFPVRTLLEKESTLRGSKAYRINDDRDDFAAALELLATDPGTYARIITSTPTWSPDSPQQPLLERRSTLKIVYVNELALTGTERL